MTHAERYLVLGLRLGKHVDGLVDCVLRPGRAAAAGRRRRRRSTRRSSRPTPTRCSPSCPTAGCATRCKGCATYAHVLAGDEISYADEVEGCYGVRPERDAR